MRKIDPAKHEEKRRQILEAAGRCFVRDGFRGASISDICAEAKISAGHLYHYFDSKEAIIGAMTEAGLEHANVRFSHMMKSSNAVSALVAEMERAKVARDRAGQLIVLDMLAEAGRNPAIGDILRQHSRELRTLLADFLREAQNRGQVDRTLDADLAAAVLLSVGDGAKALTIRDPTLDMTRCIDLLKILIARFLSPPPDSSPKRARE